ncbi:hypothetical protein [Pseudoalteromonas spongiae]|uniref:hypothetical protein n=1 Tax=Pseudoalteromonas spongiae TaxID=298657 RepID=UPI0037355200
MSEPVISSKLSYTLATMTISVPIFYALGYFFKLGYLDAYNLSISMFNEGLEGHIVNSVLFVAALLELISEAIKNYGVMFLSLLLLTWLYGVFLIYINKKKESIDKKLCRLGKNKYSEYLVFPFVMVGVTLALPFTIFISASIVIWVLHASYVVGTKVAKKEMSGFNGCARSNRCVTVLFENGKKLSGKVIAISDKYIAIYQEEKISVLPNKNLKLETESKRDIIK